MTTRMVELARGVARLILSECPWLELLLPPSSSLAGGSAELEASSVSQANVDEMLESVFIVVAFRERDFLRNETLVQRIKQDGRIYVSGTVLLGRAAARIAVAKWDVDVRRDLALVREVLMAVR